MTYWGKQKQNASGGLTDQQAIEYSMSESLFQLD